MKKNVYFLALLIMPSFAFSQLRENPDQYIKKYQNQLFNHTLVGFGIWKQQANFDGLNEVFKTNTAEYPTFDNHFIGIEVFGLTWKPTSKWKMGSGLHIGTIPEKISPSVSTSKWSINGYIFDLWVTPHYELWRNKRAFLDAYVGINTRRTGVNLRERSGQGTSDPSLEHVGKYYLVLCY